MSLKRPEVMMANHRLRAAIHAAGLTIDSLSERVGVDPKTIGRWLANESRVPHRTTRRQVATLLNVEEAHLWPALTDDLLTQVSEVVGVYPTRSAVPYSMWTQLIGGLRDRMDVLVYSGQFLVEQHDVLPVVRAKAPEGVRFRFLVGDETSAAVIQRANEEGTTRGLEGRIQMMRRYLSEVAGLPGVEIRTHGTTLYNSIYRFDNQALINGHAYGALAGQNPVLHIRHIEGGPIWRHYFESFERVWTQAIKEKTT